ncbi:MBL fold metallo-hydrolase [Parasphingorhabdus sp. DH2-15]|uniref:MBL fold metallo-hydrolase n=1 Tax=Parasphingorhabdus sp. DH2-15 TaxID=3444112 RepID=UPI003F685ECD
MKVTLLGSGTSAGVPRVGNVWGKCNPDNPKNRRSRVSLHIQIDPVTGVLIDTSPDLRQQCLDNDIDCVTHVVWTHDHADHCHGIDDLRGFFFLNREPITGYARDYTFERLERRFDYVFEGTGGYPSIVDIQPWDDAVPLSSGCILDFADQPHGGTRSTGVVIKNDISKVCYATDFSMIKDDMVEQYRDCDLLFVDCLRMESHPTHANLDMALELARHSNAKETILIHMDNSMDFDTLSNSLIDRRMSHRVSVGYDGLERELV